MAKLAQGWLRYRDTHTHIIYIYIHIMQYYFCSMKQGSRVVIRTYWAQRNPYKLLMARWANHVEQKLSICCCPCQHHFPPKKKEAMTLNPLGKAAIEEHGVLSLCSQDFFFQVVSLGCFPMLTVTTRIITFLFES